MTITIYTGLPGTGKSSTLITKVNEAIAAGQEAVVFACSESPQLAARESIRVRGHIGCRKPGLICKLDHFVSTDECIDILAQTRPGTLVAFEEAQFFGSPIIDAWAAASQRGLNVVLSTPSAKQLKALNLRGYSETRLTRPCETCDAPEAVTFLAFLDRDKTITVCQACHDKQQADARREIVRRLEEQAPYPGEKAIYQPIELPECDDWRVLRPDSEDRVELMTEILAEEGLPDGQTSYLDLGCNTGYFCYQMSRLGLSVAGVDIVRVDIELANLLSAYFRRDYARYTVMDVHKYLKETQDEQVDVTSAFSVFPWLMIQQSAEHGLEALKWFFNKTRRICFLEMGYTTEAHYKDRIGIEINRSWVAEFMKQGDFYDIRILEAKEHGLKRDIFVGYK